MIPKHIVAEALQHWHLRNASAKLVAQRENVVFQVTQNGHPYALRFHRPGYQSSAMIHSELLWMQFLRKSGLTVPEPEPATSGEMLIASGGYHVDLLTWLHGKPLGATGKPLNIPDRPGTFFKLGALMAELHLLSDSWTPPNTFERQAWDIDGLLGDDPLWNRFWDNPGLSSAQRTKVLAARDRLRADLSEHAGDFGLIHADMLRENVLLDGDRLGLIDFDDSGFGFRLFDVATTLFKNLSEPDYPILEAAFLQGYQSRRRLDTSLLETFMVLRALTYLGWIIDRMDEAGAEVRQARFIASAMPLVERFLETRAN